MHESREHKALLRRQARAFGRGAAHVGAGVIDIWVALSLLFALQSYRDGVEATWHHLRVLSEMGVWWLPGVLSLGLVLAWLNALLFQLRLGGSDTLLKPATASRPEAPAVAEERREPLLD